MKLSLITPNNWLTLMKPELEKLGHQVLLNQCSSDCDYILAMSQSQNNNIEKFHYLYPNVPLITYNWDWYDCLNKRKNEWARFVQLMKESKEVWSSSKITAEKCEKETGIKSKHWFYAFIMPDEWEGENKDEGFIIQASRQDWYKRFEGFESAAQELGIPFKSFHPNKNPRPEYVKAIKECSFVVSASTEESLGTVSAIEGLWCSKPVLMADFDSAKEVWKGHPDVILFKSDSYDDFKEKMKWLWDNRGNVPRGISRKKIEENFTPESFTRKVHERLMQI